MVMSITAKTPDVSSGSETYVILKGDQKHTADPDFSG